MRLREKLSKLSELLNSLLNVEYYDILMTFLRSDSSDYSTIYCNAWKFQEGTNQIYKFWDAFHSSKINVEQLKELMPPDCIAKSSFTLINLSEGLIRSFPHSLLQVKDLPVHFLLGDNLEEVLKMSVMNRPQNPKIRWSDWILYPEFDFKFCFDAHFYYKFAWQLVDSESFPRLSEMKSECLIKWLLGQNELEFFQLSDEAILMRTLTLLMWKSFVKPSQVKLFKDRLVRRFSETPAINLSFYIITKKDIVWNSELLLSTISILEPYFRNNDFIGDWFIGILILWKDYLKELNVNIQEHVNLIEKLFDFITNSLDLTFQGAIKLTELFDPTFRLFIEIQMIEKYKKSHLKTFYREYPNYFQQSFSLVPIGIRWSSLLRKKRTFSKSNGTFLLKSDYNIASFSSEDRKDFLFLMADKFRRGIEDLPQISLNPALISFKLRLVSFKSMTRLFLLSITGIPDWFQKLDDGSIIPLPKFPDLFWELLGYFMIQSVILNVPTPFKLQRRFFYEMMKEDISFFYIQKLSEPFKELKTEKCSVLSLNLVNRFTLSSIFATSETPIQTDHVTDFSLKAFELYYKGMKSMRRGINYVLEPFKFLADELYLNLFKE